MGSNFLVGILHEALRSAGGIRRPLRSLGKKNCSKLCEAYRGPRLAVGANWRLDNAKSPAAMLQDTARMQHA